MSSSSSPGRTSVRSATGRRSSCIAPCWRTIPTRAATHADIGATLYYLDRTDEAIRSLERALALDPSLDSARTNLEKIRKRARKLEE